MDPGPADDEGEELERWNEVGSDLASLECFRDAMPNGSLTLGCGWSF